MKIKNVPQLYLYNIPHLFYFIGVSIIHNKSLNVSPSHGWIEDKMTIVGVVAFVAAVCFISYSIISISMFYKYLKKYIAVSKNIKLKKIALNSEIFSVCFFILVLFIFTENTNIYFKLFKIIFFLISISCVFYFSYKMYKIIEVEDGNIVL